MDSRVYYLLHGHKAPNIPPETIAEDFLFRGNRRQQKKLWAQVGAELTREYTKAHPGRKPWAWERYGAPEQAEPGPQRPVNG